MAVPKSTYTAKLTAFPCPRYRINLPHSIPFKYKNPSLIRTKSSFLSTILMRPYPAAATKAAAMHKAVNLKFVNAHTTENNLISPAPKMPERYKKYKKTTGKTISGRNQMMLAT